MPRPLNRLRESLRQRALRRPSRRWLIAAAAVTTAVVALAATLYVTTGPWFVGTDDELARQVPAAIRADGRLSVATDPSYAPAQFRDDDGELAGFDVDLVNAIAETLGMKTTWHTVGFDDVVPGVRAGRYELGASAIPVNDARTSQTIMVGYFTSTTRWVTRTDRPRVQPDDACGRTVAVVAATVQVDDVTARSTACTAAGKSAITVTRHPTGAAAAAAVKAGKADALVADSPTCAHAVRTADDALRVTGGGYDPTPLGYAVNPDHRAFADLVHKALQRLRANGTYIKILDRWGVKDGALRTADITP